MNNHERNQFIENLIGEAHEVLAEEEVQQSTPSAPELNEALGRLFVPNVRNDRVQLPDEYLDQEAYPILACETGESIVYPLLQPTPQQLANMLEAYRAMQPIEPVTPEELTGLTVEDMFEVDVAQPSSPAIADTMRRMTAMAWEEDQFSNYNGQDLVVLGRPGIIVNTLQPNPLPSLNLLHELVHVEQIVRDTLLPISAYSNHGVFLARMELEAYHRHAQIGLGVITGLRFRERAAQDLSVHAAAMIEQAIFNYADKSAPFEPTSELISFLDERDHLRLITKPAVEASLRSFAQ